MQHNVTLSMSEKIPLYQKYTIRKKNEETKYLKLKKLIKMKSVNIDTFRCTLDGCKRIR
jgi:hypothetical protein